MNTRQPVIIGISHIEQRQDDIAIAKEPIELMIDAVHEAAADAGNLEVLKPNSIRVIKGSWPYENPAKAIAERIGHTGAETVISPFGGNFVQTVMNLSAVDIQNGLHDLIIMTGAECGNTQAKAAKAKAELNWQALPGEPDRRIGAEKDMRHNAERAIRLGRPIQVYPIMEIALRHELGLGVGAHLEHISQLWSRFSDVASRNPNAWIKDARTAEEIKTISKVNRPVSFPYTKFLNSNNNVDQAAAIILCSVAKAQALGVPESQWVYPWCGSDAQDHYYLSNRDNFYSSPAIRFAGNRCLEMADTSANELDLVDVYSCFPVAVQVACRELGLDLERPLTVTGGLTWAGGPLNNYVMHSIVRTAQLLREASQTQKGLITANGGYITKHAFGFYSNAAPEQPFRHEDLQAKVDATPKRDVIIDHEGSGNIESYGVMYGPDGLDKAFVAARLQDGRRAWGICRDQDVLQTLIEQDLCGADVHLKDHVATI